MSTAKLVRWGNSVGIRISAQDLKAANAHIGEEFKITVDNRGGFNLTPITNPQQEWLNAFNAIADTEKNSLLSGDFKNQFDEDEWTW